MSKITDKSLAEEGRRALGWAGENMPILASIRERYGSRMSSQSGIRGLLVVVLVLAAFKRALEIVG